MKTIQRMPGTAAENGYKIVQGKGLAIVGMSPGNSHFNPQVIKELLQYASATFSKTKILIADVPAIHTYKGIGYSEKRAQKKARLNGNNLQNHSLRVIQTEKLNVELIEWADEVESAPEYQKELTHIQELYEENIAFRVDARNTTRNVVQSKLKEHVNIEEAVDEAVWYLLKELAFLLASPQLFDEPLVSYVYHHRWPIYENLVNGKYDGNVQKNLGFILISPSLPSHQEK